MFLTHWFQFLRTTRRSLRASKRRQSAVPNCWQACEHLEDRLLLTAALGDVDEGPEVHELSVFASDEELEEYLIDDALERWEYLFGKPAWGCYSCVGGGPLRILSGGPEGDVIAVATTFEDVDAGGGAGFSGTNTQVDGVDEADIVKTDGDYLYIVNTGYWVAGQELIIVDAQPAEEMSVVSRTPLDGWPVAQYLNGDRLTVITKTYGDYSIQPADGSQTDRLAVDASIAIWPGPIGRSRLSMTVFDVSDRAAPSIYSETIIDGSYVDSRAVGDDVYVVVSNSFLLRQPKLVALEPEPSGPGSESTKRIPRRAIRIRT